MRYQTHLVPCSNIHALVSTMIWIERLTRAFTMLFLWLYYKHSAENEERCRWTRGKRKKTTQAGSIMIFMLIRNSFVLSFSRWKKKKTAKKKHWKFPFFSWAEFRECMSAFSSFFILSFWKHQLRMEKTTVSTMLPYENERPISSYEEKSPDYFITSITVAPLGVGNILNRNQGKFFDCHFVVAHRRSRFKGNIAMPKGTKHTKNHKFQLYAFIIICTGLRFVVD